MSVELSRGGRATMRILHSVGHLARGGIETWLYEVVRRLGPPAYEHHIMVWTREEEAFTAEFRNAGAQVHALPFHLNPIRFANGFRNLVRAHEEFDVLHTHGTQFHGFVMGLAKACGIPSRIAHSHTDIRPVLDQAGLVYRGYAWAGHAAIRSCATAGRGVSNVAARSMFGPNWREDKRWGLLHCGIDLERFATAPMPAMRASLGIPNGRFVLGNIGRFETQKNQAFLLEVLAALLSRSFDAHLLLVGDGSLRDTFEREAGQRDLAGRVTFLRDTLEVPAVLNSAMDAFVLTSLYEGLPLVLVEAQAAGLVCLTSEAAAPEATVMPSLVRRLPLEAGADAWADAVLALPPRRDARDPELHTCFASSDFSIERSIRLVDELYRSAE